MRAATVLQSPDNSPLPLSKGEGPGVGVDPANCANSEMHSTYAQVYHWPHGT